MKKEAHKQKAKAERIKQLTQHVFNKKVLHWSYCSGCGLTFTPGRLSPEAPKRGKIFEFLC